APASVGATISTTRSMTRVVFPVPAPASTRTFRARSRTASRRSLSSGRARTSVRIVIIFLRLLEGREAGGGARGVAGGDLARAPPRGVRAAHGPGGAVRASLVIGGVREAPREEQLPGNPEPFARPAQEVLELRSLERALGVTRRHGMDICGARQLLPAHEARCD